MNNTNREKLWRQRLGTRLLDYGRKIGLISCLAINGMCVAADHSGHGSTQPQDREKIWKTALARQPLAVTATFDASGKLWQAFVKEGHVMVSQSDNQGKTFSTPVLVNPKPELVAAVGENRPKILVGSNGNIYVSYTRNLETPFAGNIRFSRSVDGGKSFSAPITINNNLDPITHSFDAMGINKRGQIYIAWLDKRDISIAAKKGEKYSGLAIYYALSDDEGKTFHTDTKAVDHSCECCRVAMAMDDDTPIIVWRHIFGKNIRDHAMLRLDGKSQPIRLSYGNWEVDACPHHGPAISIANDGNYHFVWFSNSLEQHGLFYSYSSDQGKHFSRPLNFGNFQAQAAHPYVLSLGQRVFIAWKEFDGMATGIYLMHSVDGGNLWSSPKKIASTIGNSDYPFLMSDGNKNYLSWNTDKEGYRLINLAETAQ
ncbi:Lipoprotein [Candidatus Nitrotoga sp. HW29]|uniref:sialidase family protein n=1 Tax=Candidatus Nitrotoga sp. HW29 TaxID=2886963 RepID=UPI001EF35628|nr:sialidase family protein [Candidatus Nitrotoga sp. HW29]CAH1905640.1 Lipoprotein [Candidatus Nitrotoga sp. HW29]